MIRAVGSAVGSRQLFKGSDFFVKDGINLARGLILSLSLFSGHFIALDNAGIIISSSVSSESLSFEVEILFSTSELLTRTKKTKTI